VILDLGEVGRKKLSEGLRMPDGRGPAVLMILGDNPHATRLDLIEWKNPKPKGRQICGTPEFAVSPAHTHPREGLRGAQSEEYRVLDGA
jgi:hypothetical protein